MEKENISEMDIIMLPGRLMFFIWLNNLFYKKTASFDKENGNVINLSPLPSSWFSIGKDFETGKPFLGIQDRMLPWFFEISWEKAVISFEKGKLYLSCSKNGQEDIAISINIRKKRLNVLWNTKAEENPERLEFRIIKVNNSGKVDVSERVYKSLPLIISDDIETVAPKPMVVMEKEKEYEDSIKAKFEAMYQLDSKGFKSGKDLDSDDLF